ncbi:MAG: dehydratase [Hyphomicrobiales bacterium]|nr:dehydratase [Hyphomicrobiales bacterium]
MMWLEEFPADWSVELGSHLFTAEEIVAFARDWDPQPFHLDEDAGRASLFGGLTASGWHVACAWMALWIAHQNREMEARAARGEIVPVPGPSPGFDDMRWLKPVVAGQTVAYRSSLLTARPSASRPEWGIVSTTNEGFVEGERVFHFTGRVFWPRRPGAEIG